MEFRRSACRSLRSIFHIVCTTAYHARRCDEGEAAAAVGFKAECHHIGAACATGIRQGVVFPCLEGIAAGVELVALRRVGNGTSAATTAPWTATALRTTGADADACAGNPDIIVVIAVEAFLRAAFCGVGKSYAVANGDGTCLSCIRVDSIVAVVEAYRHAAVEEDLTRRVDAVVVAFEVMLTAFNIDLSFRLQTFGATLCCRDSGGATVNGSHAAHLNGFSRGFC